jgi:hypothetical protein
MEYRLASSYHMTPLVLCARGDGVLNHRVEVFGESSGCGATSSERSSGTCIQTVELRPDTDVEITVVALSGAILASEKSGAATLVGDFAVRVVDGLLLGLSAR